LKKIGNTNSLDELLSLWAPIRFSSHTINEHRKQSDYTVLYSCPKCKLKIFLPQIIGTKSFYKTLQGDKTAFYYVDEKWDFNEGLKDAKLCNAIIEIGCGTGSFLEKVKPFVSEIYGTEYNEKVLQIARNKGLNIFSTEEDIRKFKGQFDIAFSFHVLEHVADPVTFIEELCSWTKLAGKIAISVPNQDGPVKYIDPCIQNMPPHHATRWHAKTFKYIAKKFDLKIERIAFEPLILRDHYYYSIYWVDKIFGGESSIIKAINKILHLILPVVFRNIFRGLSKLNITSLSLLKGQAIYVLMSKREGQKT